MSNVEWVVAQFAIRNSTMKSLRTTNWLLLGIFLALLAHLGVRLGLPTAIAETFKLDTCVTAFPNDKPASYLHVVPHSFSGDSN